MNRGWGFADRASRKAARPDAPDRRERKPAGDCTVTWDSMSALLENYYAERSTVTRIRFTSSVSWERAS